MASTYNLKAIHCNGSSTIQFGLKDNAFKLGKETEDTVSLTDKDDELISLAAKSVSVEETPTEDTDAINKKYFEENKPKIIFRSFSPAELANL